MGWLLLWVYFIYDKPRSHPSIQEEELNEIELSMGTYSSEYQWTSPVPWFSIWTSAPFWAIVAAHFVQNWGFFTLLSELPYYFKLESGWKKVAAKYHFGAHCG